ncbi:unnamed protein product [Coregonus sp. 'balchen']|nr:unnamed protein product [Coregonus sp. 'balchen']
MASLSLSLGLLVLCTLALVQCGPYDDRVRVWCGPAFGGMTSVLKNQANPTWPGEFNFLDIIDKSVLKLEVWNDNVGPDNRLGTCTTTIRKGTHIETCHLKKGTVYYTYTYDYSH